MRRIGWLVAALALVAAPRASAVVVEQDRAVATAAGARVVAGPLDLEVLVGDIAIGESATGGTDLWHGFWAPLPPPPASAPEASSVVHAYFAAPSPNPAGAPLALRFGLERAQHVTLAVHDLAGRNVRTLVADRLDAGEHVARWDLRRTDGRRVASGLYFVRFEGEAMSASRKVVVP